MGNDSSYSDNFNTCSDDGYPLDKDEVRWAKAELDAFNRGDSVFAGGGGDYVHFEGDSGFNPYRLENLARLYVDNPDDFTKLLSEQPQLQETLDEAVKNLPSCEPETDEPETDEPGINEQTLIASSSDVVQKPFA